MVGYGFTPEVPRSTVGFVRHHVYVKGDIRIKCCVGGHGDWWEVLEGPAPAPHISYYWGGLEPYLKSIEE